MENSTEKNKTCSWWHCCCTGSGGVGWGIFFLALGVYFIAQDLGYIVSGVSVWSIAAAAFGLYLLIRGMRR